MAKPIKCLELHYPMIQFLTMKITLSVYNLVTQYFMLLCCCVRVNLVPPLRSWSRQTTWARQTSTMLQVFGLKTLQVHLFSSVFASCRTTMVFTRISLWYVSNNWVFHGGGDCRFTFAFYILHDFQIRCIIHFFFADNSDILTLSFVFHRFVQLRLLGRISGIIRSTGKKSSLIKPLIDFNQNTESLWYDWQSFPSCSKSGEHYSLDKSLLVNIISN